MRAIPHQHAKKPRPAADTRGKLDEVEGGVELNLGYCAVVDAEGNGFAAIGSAVKNEKHGTTTTPSTPSAIAP